MLTPVQTSDSALFAYRGRYARRAALALFSLYLAVFPGSTITVALDAVPAWGEWMGGALLLLQGAVVLCWLIGCYGRRGVVAAALVCLLAWGVEYLGVTTGFPFGRYQYTEQLRPQLPGAVPLAIPCAWLMVVVGAWQIADCRLQIADYASRITHHASRITEQRTKHEEQTWAHPVRNRQYTIRSVLLAATLIVLLDAQIEPVATAINRYWVWLDVGAYYGVPATNFAAWWAIGLVMAVVVVQVLGRPDQRPTTNDQRPTSILRRVENTTFRVLRFTFYAIPAGLYVLNTLMFVAINLARGYVAAGLAGVIVLLTFAIRITSSSAAFSTRRA